MINKTSQINSQKKDITWLYRCLALCIFSIILLSCSNSQNKTEFDRLLEKLHTSQDDLKAAFEAYKEKSFSKSQKLFKKAAQAGNPEAQAMLGIFYTFTDSHRHLDSKKGLLWFKKAAEQGNPHAQYHYAYAITHPILIPLSHNNSDPKKKWMVALPFYRSAAEQGHPGAQMIMGDYYFEGTGIDRSGVEYDLVKSYLWYSLAKKNMTEKEASLHHVDKWLKIVTQRLESVNQINKAQEELKKWLTLHPDAMLDWYILEK